MVKMIENLIDKNQLGLEEEAMSIDESLPKGFLILLVNS